MAIAHPQTKTLSELISKKRYVVPTYQRPYAWELDQASELWEDIRNNTPSYFLGILILRQKKDSEYEIVDGQQRLATLILLLRAVVEVFGEGSQEGIEIQNGYIHQKGPLEKNAEFTLTLSKRDKLKFEALLTGGDYIAKRKYASWQRLEKVKKFFVSKLEELKNTEGVSGITTFILDRVMKLNFIDVQVENDSDVYLFFETLNDRGMDLSIADLLKNRICALSSNPIFPPDDDAKRVDDITELLGEGSIKSFLLHYCWAYSDEKNPPPRKALMDWFNKVINIQKNSFLSKLEENALAYSYLIKPDQLRGKEKEVLVNLKVLGATRCYPLLLIGKHILSESDFIKLCRAVEILTFRHSTVCKKDSKILESVYYDLAKDLKKGVSIDKILGILNIQSKKISDETFLALFNEYIPENHKVAKYVLLKIEDSYNDGKSTPPDREKATLEHILAQKLDWIDKDEYVERLGNLTLLSEPLNREAGMKEFIYKRDYYTKEIGIQITLELLKYSDFTVETIKERQSLFAKHAIKIWNPDILK